MHCAATYGDGKATVTGAVAENDYEQFSAVLDSWLLSNNNSNNDNSYYHDGPFFLAAQDAGVLASSRRGLLRSLRKERLAAKESLRRTSA